ncbi:MAG: hypothetical protein ACFB0C_01935 [Leptolyngbyaceae cyanobacterium]
MPFQSRLLNTTIRQVQRCQDRVGRLWRQAQLQATWGMELLFYPLIQLRRSLKYRLKQRQVRSIDSGSKKPHHKVTHLLRQAGQFLRQRFIKPLQFRRRLSQSAPLTHQTQPEIQTAAKSLLASLGSGTKALVKGIGAPLQKISTRINALTLELAQANTPLAQNLDSRELETSWGRDSSLPKAILSWIKAAFNHFFGGGAAAVQAIAEGSKQFEETGIEHSLLPVTSFSVALLPGVENLVRVVWRVIRRGMGAVMRLGRDRTLLAASPLPPSQVSISPWQPLGSTNAFDFQPVLSAESSYSSSEESGSNLATPFDISSSLQTTLIEVSATVVGYVEHPLKFLWTGLDRAIRFLEDVLIDGFTWLWRWIQKAKRYCLDCLN